MPRRTTRILVCCITACAAACAGTREATDAAGRDGAITVRGEELTGSSILLEALAQRVPSLRISRPATDCPVLFVRGQAVGRATGSATVYVDGTRMRDTCVLQQLQSAAVERVELYPVSARPTGFVAGPGGLVLVFTRR